MELPEEVQKDLVQYQALQNQLNVITNQLNAIKVELSMIEEAIKEVENSDKDVYKAVGPVLIRKNKDEVLNWLKERKEMLEVKMKSLEKKVEALQNSLLQLKKRLETFFQSQGGAPSGQ